MNNSARSSRSRKAAAVFASTFAAMVASTSTASTAWAAGTDGGLALIVNSTDGQNLNTGGSSTQWTLKLPPGAACSGDTAGQQYHVFAYIVDASANPNVGSLTFDSNGPVGTGTVYPLYDVGGNPFTNKATNTGDARVIGIPPFNFSLFSIDGRATGPNPDGTLALPAATYNIGIACAKADGTGDKYWNTQLIMSADGSDINGETWATQPNPQVPEFPLSVALPVSAAAILGVGFLVSRRRRPEGASAIAV